ncbi:MAG: hypothetical protein KDE19_14940 [Caldilineaceae bacterium]|nr:hypothetical protein [Caldilineaceae bacterium]
MTFERNGELQVDLENHRLRFFLRFMVKGYSYAPGGPVCTCTADCGGAGTLEFDITDLPEGTYQVELGTAMLGEIFIPVFGSSECLSNGQ